MIRDAARPRPGHAVAGLVGVLCCAVGSIGVAHAQAVPPPGESVRAKVLELVAHERYQEAHKILDDVSNENWNKILRHTQKKR